MAKKCSQCGRKSLGKIEVSPGIEVELCYKCRQDIILFTLKILAGRDIIEEVLAN